MRLLAQLGCLFLVASVADRSATSAPPPKFEHPEDARAPLWKGELLCTDAETPGIVWQAMICGKSRGACEASLERTRPVLDGLLNGATYSACAVPDLQNLQRIYCFNDGTDVVCSGKQAFCEQLHERSNASRKIKGRSCKKYRVM